MLSIVDLDYKVWAKRYGLVVQEKECANCKKMFLASIPVADKGMRGLQIPDHGCPAGFNRSYFIFIDEKLEDSLMRQINSEVIK